MNRAMIVGVVGMMFAGYASGDAVKQVKNELRPVSASCRTSGLPFKLGVARWSMHAHSFKRTLEILQDIDCHYLGMPEGSIKYGATDAEIAAYKAECARYGIEVVSAGPEYFDNEKQVAALFDFAKRYGMKYVSVVPYELDSRIANVADRTERKKIIPDDRQWRIESDRMMDILEKYVKKYDIRAAVHNHGPDTPVLYPTAEAALKRIGNRDKRIGICLDVGHERRAGLDPVAFIRNHGDRVFEIHMKNIKIDPVRNFAKEGPRGELDIYGIVKALVDIKYGGFCLVEFEKDYSRNEVPLAESIGYYRGIMDGIEANQR